MDSRTTGFVYADGKIIDAPGSVTVMVSGAGDLTALAAKVGPGAIAYTAGWQAAWQLGIDGETWSQFIGA